MIDAWTPLSQNVFQLPDLDDKNSGNRRTSSTAEPVATSPEGLELGGIADCESFIGRRPGNSRIGGIDPIVWLLVGSVFVFIGSSRQAWFELRGWYRQLDSTLELAMEIVEEDHQELIRRDLAGLSGPQLAVRKRKLHRLARSELEKRAAELLSPQEIELLAVSSRGAISWALIVTGSFCLALDPIIELFFR